MCALTFALGVFSFGVETSVATAQKDSPLISEDNATLSTYNDEDIGFGINYPSDWTQDNSNSQHFTLISFDSPNKDANVDIRVFPTGDYKTIKEYGDKTFKQADDLTLLQYYRNGTTLLSGKPALKAIYITTSNPGIYGNIFGYQSTTSKAMMVATMVPEKKSIFAIVYYADSSNFNKYLPAVEEMVKSFKIGSKAPIIQERTKFSKYVELITSAITS